MEMELLILFLCVTFASANYWKDREYLLKNEESTYVGHNIKLTQKEELVNQLLMTAKNKEFEEGFQHPENFLPARHFFLAKEDINKSPVFKFIQKMPKGGALHVHNKAMVSLDYVLYNITYRDHLLACQNEKGLKLTFADPIPEDDCWVPVKTLREQSSSVEEFDDWLRSRLTLETDEPSEKYPDINTVWTYFQDVFEFSSPMLDYRKTFLDYCRRALEEFRADNVNYLEIRATFSSAYDLDGSRLSPFETLGLIKQVSDKFMSDYPDFLGIKYIYSPSRNADNTKLKEHLERFKLLKEQFPDFLVGFDLVGQEDLGRPLIEFVNQLKENVPDVKFYFHAGETNWNGMSTDENLIDALLLNTTRVGHGFALLKHPGVVAEMKHRGVAVEVCPVSHQVLGLLRDLRNHPASALLAQDFPVVISSDDPGMWGALPLSHDFYEAFMGVANKQADLRLLKQLALNSLQYSSLSPCEKTRVIRKFKKRWTEFIDDVYLFGITN